MRLRVITCDGCGSEISRMPAADAPRITWRDHWCPECVLAHPRFAQRLALRPEVEAVRQQMIARLNERWAA